MGKEGYALDLFLRNLRLMIDDFIDSGNDSKDSNEWVTDDAAELLDKFYNYSKNFGRKSEEVGT